MDFTVLDIGLRNHQISSVQCFFKIQTETFALTQTNQKIAERDRQYDDWKQVFVKLNNVIAANINNNFHNFGVCLARIGFQTSNELLKIVNKTDSDSNGNKTEFIKLFIENIRSLRLAIRLANSKQLNVCQEKHFKNFDWDSNSTEIQVLSDSLRNNSLVLGQYWLKSIKNIDNNWNVFIKKVINFAVKSLQSNDLERFRQILIQTGLEFNQIIGQIFLFTSDNCLRQLLLTKFKDNLIDINQNQDMFEIIKSIDHMKTQTNISLTVDWITKMSGQSLQRSFFLSFCQINDLNKNYLSSDVVWNYLVDTNDYQSLNLWIKRVDTNFEFNYFPFDWNLRPDFIEYVYEMSSVSTKELILNSLAIRGCLCSQEYKDFQTILYRLGRIESNLTINSSNGFIDDSQILSNSCLKVKQFFDELIRYLCKHKFNQLLFIYSKNFNQMSIVSDNPLIDLLKSSIRCIEKTSDQNILENILLTAQYVYSVPNQLTIQSLIENIDPYLGLICVTYCSLNFSELFSKTTKSENNLQKYQNLIINSFETRFPIIFSCFAETLTELSLNEFKCETPTVYSLLTESVPFDVTKMFCWQSMNNLVDMNDHNIKSMVFNQLPHFSNTRLADLYGLKANLTFTYYLNEGRVIEAYNRFISNVKALNSKSVEMAGRRAALVAYNDTTDIQIAVSAIIFQQLLNEDSTQTLIHLSVANFIMSLAADFLSLNPKLQQMELSNLLKKSHYYNDKRAATKLLQLTVTAITRKYKNYMNIQIEECFDWKIAISFATLHNLELPLDLLIKCAASDNWLLFAICCQLHQYPKESVFAALKHYNNECISEHLYKAFQSSHTILTDNESGDHSRILNRKQTQKRSTKHLRNVLYSKIGLEMSQTLPPSDSPLRQSKYPSRVSTSPTEDTEYKFVKPMSDDQSIASETDYNGIETISMVSSSNASDGEDIPKLDLDNCPKDLFQLILNFQTDSSRDSRRALLYASIPLSNPILCLIAGSADYESQKLDTFSCFSCWLLASVDFGLRKQFCQRIPNLDPLNWTAEDNYQLLDLIMRDIRNYSILLRGLKLFSLNIKVIVDLLKFMFLFFCEKNYYNVQNLKSFQDNLWKYEEPNNCDIFFTKQWIQRTSVIILSNALRNAKNHELVILLRHYDFARIQDSFSENIKVEDFRKLYRLSQCLIDTNIELPISELLSEDIDIQKKTEEDMKSRYSQVFNGVISSLQQSQHFSEAKNFAKIAEIESNDLIINEWSLRASHNLDSFEFWEKCWDSLVTIDPTLQSAFKMFFKFLSQISSVIVKCFLIFKCLIASQNNERESHSLETMLWKCILCIENDLYQTNQIWSRIWSDIIGFIKSNQNKKSNKELIGSSSSSPSSNTTTITNSKELHQTINIVMEKLLSSSCLEKAQEVSRMFSYNHQDLDIVLTCVNLAKGMIKDLSEAPLNVQLKTKAIGQMKTMELSSHFSKEQKETIGFIESISNLLTIGRKACQRVLLYFKISCVLNRSYQEIESSEMDELELLRCLISVHSTTNDALSFAKQLISLNEIPDENIASIICSQTLSTLKNSEEEEEISRNNSFSNLVEMSTSFLSLIRLMEDTTILGYKLLKESESLSKDSQNNYILTKLYIKVHECFTLACDVRGIALVLRKARVFITQNLVHLKDFKSILRLMTGIGRYSEMTYCFDLFKENNEFELLFSKHTDKAPQLRIALLDYLKGDKELFPLVALRFCLYREIGENHEKSAKQQFNDLKYKLNSNTLVNQKQQMELIMNELIDAHESYSKAGCYSRADTCGKLARLLALQIHYVPNNVILINMNSTEISQFIENNRNFHEALIVAEAYDYNTSWVSAVFKHFILNNDSNYLSDYSSRRDISSSFVEELVDKYYIQYISQKNLTNDKSIQMKKSIQRLIQYIDDYELRFKIASKLNLTQITHQMLSEESGAYLQDLRRNGLL